MVGVGYKETIDDCIDVNDSERIMICYDHQRRKPFHPGSSSDLEWSKTM